MNLFCKLLIGFLAHSVVWAANKPDLCDSLWSRTADGTQVSNRLKWKDVSSLMAVSTRQREVKRELGELTIHVKAFLTTLKAGTDNETSLFSRLNSYRNLPPSERESRMKAIPSKVLADIERLILEVTPRLQSLAARQGDLSKSLLTKIRATQSDTYHPSREEYIMLRELRKRLYVEQKQSDQLAAIQLPVTLLNQFLKERRRSRAPSPLSSSTNESSANKQTSSLLEKDSGLPVWLYLMMFTDQDSLYETAMNCSSWHDRLSTLNPPEAHSWREYLEMMPRSVPQAVSTQLQDADRADEEAAALAPDLAEPQPDVSEEGVLTQEPALAPERTQIDEEAAARMAIVADTESDDFDSARPIPEDLRTTSAAASDRLQTPSPANEDRPPEPRENFQTNGEATAEVVEPLRVDAEPSTTSAETATTEAAPIPSQEGVQEVPRSEASAAAPEYPSIAEITKRALAEQAARAPAEPTTSLPAPEDVRTELGFSPQPPHEATERATIQPEQPAVSAEKMTEEPLVEPADAVLEPTPSSADRIKEAPPETSRRIALEAAEVRSEAGASQKPKPRLAGVYDTDKSADKPIDTPTDKPTETQKPVTPSDASRGEESTKGPANTPDPTPTATDTSSPGSDSPNY